MAVYLPRKDYNLPQLDLLSVIFDSPISWTEEDTVLHAEADDPGNQITKGQARILTKRVAYHLRHDFGVGCSPSTDVVTVISSGQVMLPVLFYGVIAAGGVYSSASFTCTASELTAQIKRARSNIVLASEDCSEVAISAANNCGISLNRVLILQSMGHRKELRCAATDRNYLQEPWCSNQRLDWERIQDPETLKNRTICLLYSSGTTGLPKGVRLSHQNLVSSSLLPSLLDREYILQRRHSDSSYVYRGTTLAHLPTAHIGGCQGYFTIAAVSGVKVYWMRRFDFAKFLEYNKRYQITEFFTVPPIYLMIAKSPHVTDQFQSLQRALSGAAPLGPQLQAAAEKRLGCLITQTWGLTETSGGVTMLPWDGSLNDNSGSVGALMPNCRLRIVDDDERDVGDGEEGELLISGPTVMQGYHENLEATQNSFTHDGVWYKTGDIGQQRGQLLYIVDRKKELIKYKGLQVAPAEIEGLLLSHPLIQDAAVVGVTDSESGNELPRAYVVADRAQIPGSEILSFVSSRLAAHKQLRGGVVYVSAIPKSGSGKILRRELRKMAAEAGRSSKL
ncbi:putative NRPS-like protein biosynthetic cluster [Aspergillus tubingensis]|nr:putative NRPS-like protein biosynthetic cluster [Aspergillus tubingensis]